MSTTLATATPPGIRVKKYKDGTPFWEAQISRPNLDGKRQSPLSKSFRSEAEAIAWRTEELSKRAATAAAAPAPHTPEGLGGRLAAND